VFQPLWIYDLEPLIFIHLYTVVSLLLIVVNIPLPYGLHQFIHLTKLLIYVRSALSTQIRAKKERTAHLLDLRHVHAFPLPRIAFQLLGVHLPLSQEANLQCISKKSIYLPKEPSAYNVHWVLHVAVRPELALDVFVAEYSHLPR
jgi:hypothetical protein